GFKSGRIAFTVPDTVTSVTVAEEAATGVSNDTNLPNFLYSVSMGTSSIAGPDGEIATFLLQFSEPLTSTAQITLADTSYMYDTSRVYYGITDLEDGDIQIEAANVNIPAFDESGEELEEVGEIPMSDAITVSVDEDSVTDGVSDYYIVATVKNGDDDAVYGTDYVATYNGVELTYAQYSNLINGYFSASNVADLGVTSMQDVIDNLVYVLYDENVTVSAQLVDALTSEILNPDDDTQSLDKPTATSTPKPAKMTITSKVSSTTTTTVTVGKNITLTAKVSNLTDEQISDGSYEYVLSSANEDYLDYLSQSTDEDNVYTVKFEALKAKTSVPVTINYVVDDETVATASVTIKVAAESSGTTSTGSGSTGSGSTGSGSTGAIANANTTTSTGTSLFTTFTDLSDASWASQAILALAQKGIVSGRGDGTFDPNGNITRAEYCQILVGAIGKTSESADSSFADVASDAWYYHAVSVASNYGIVVGYGDGNFGPNELITRQDMALMTYKAAQVMSLGVAATTATSFTDADQISAYALEAVASLNNAGIINGLGDGTYGPLATATRAQAAVILYQAFVQ
ncbi:MAG: S-layer homology domain-containing protein, partial [Oscillospiraceae bacterium]|nr:S-layer homology domain-containing protein [Oscillospiraceae bacterium]